MGISLNVAFRNKHVPELERYIGTIKEISRAIAVSLPHEVPAKTNAEMVYN